MQETKKSEDLNPNSLMIVCSGYVHNGVVICDSCKNFIKLNKSNKYNGLLEKCAKPIEVERNFLLSIIDSFYEDKEIDSKQQYSYREMIKFHHKCSFYIKSVKINEE